MGLVSKTSFFFLEKVEPAWYLWTFNKASHLQNLPAIQEHYTSLGIYLSINYKIIKRFCLTEISFSECYRTKHYILSKSEQSIGI